MFSAGVNGNPNDFNHDPAQWFNTAVFSRNFIGRFGDAGHDIVIGPGTADFDFSLLKNSPLWREDRYLQFRSEFFNLFNHPIFDNPTATNLTVVSPTFGKITSASVQDPRFASRQIQFAPALSILTRLYFSLEPAHVLGFADNVPFQRTVQLRALRAFS